MSHKSSLRFLASFEDIDIWPVTPLLLKAFFKLVSGNPQSTSSLSMSNFVRFLGLQVPGAVAPWQELSNLV